ncbi:MAG: uroporphyrinogen decarboxylase family protein [Deltaproteobacteria bacterium]|nr:uroporphyrinogen decarboxylase family protein [Deltaproteobacteria bacterium]
MLTPSGPGQVQGLKEWLSLFPRMEYSPRQRLSAVLAGRPCDRVPVLPLLAGWAAHHFSEGSPLETGQHPDRIAKVQISAREALEYDGLFAYADPLYIPEAFGCRVRFSASGLLVEPLALLPQNATVETIDEISLPDPERSGRLPVILAAVRKLAEYSRGEIPVIGLFEGPFTTAGRLFETDRLLRLVYRNPPVLNRILDRVTDLLLSFGQRLAENGAHLLLIPEPTGSASLISPRMFNEWVLPRLQRITRHLGLPCILHICGDTSPLLTSMAESGARVLSLDQCMDLKRSRNQLPGVVLGGNVDPVQALLLGTVETVRENTLDCLRRAGTEKFMLMSGCSLAPQTPVENIRAMIRTAREYGPGQSEDAGRSR